MQARAGLSNNVSTALHTTASSKVVAVPLHRSPLTPARCQGKHSASAALTAELRQEAKTIRVHYHRRDQNYLVSCLAGSMTIGPVVSSSTVQELQPLKAVQGA